MALLTNDEVVLQGDQFWIVRRRRLYGPFDYQWSMDLYGIQLRYQGREFGEICSDTDFFADLKPFGLPLTVARVAALTCGTIIHGIHAGTSDEDRIRHLRELLQRFHLQRFAVRSGDP